MRLTVHSQPINTKSWANKNNELRRKKTLSDVTNKFVMLNSENVIVYSKNTSDFAYENNSVKIIAS